MKFNQLLTSAIVFLFASAPGKVAKNWQLYKHNIQYPSLPDGKNQTTLVLIWHSLNNCFKSINHNKTTQINKRKSNMKMVV